MTVIKCLQCGFEVPTNLVEISSFSAPLFCWACRRLMDSVTVTEWGAWIEKQAKLRSGKLWKWQRAAHASSLDLNRAGLLAELAACLVLCPGYLSQWRTSVEEGGNNRGRDLAANWLNIDKPVEVKYTPYHGDKGYLVINPPCEGIMSAEFVEDSYYLLVGRQNEEWILRGWVDRHVFVQRKAVDPFGPDKPCWGVLWSKLDRIDSFPRPLKIVYAGCAPGRFRVSLRLKGKAELWWGYSKQHNGWVFINWQDHRNSNMPPRDPRFLVLVECSSGREKSVRFEEWSAPDYQTADKYIESLSDPAFREEQRADLLGQQRLIAPFE